jgi:type IV pilus assembly protein PilE
MVRRHRAPFRLRRRQGFTLIEAMIVVALLAIILAIAIPSYRDYVIRSNRSAARQVLMEAAQYLERNYTAAGCYNYRDTPSCRAQSGEETVKPSTLLRAPSEGKQSYVVTWTYANNGQEYTLTATPCGDADPSCPAGSDAGFKDPKCGALTLTQTGLRGAAGDLATCWQR